MRLSEAMRLGAMYGPQLKYILTKDNGSNCALGAIVFAIYGVEGWSKAVGERWGPVFNRYPHLIKYTTNPVTKWAGILSGVIVDLNNNQSWTRERIADWIEQTFETPQPKEGGDANDYCSTSVATAPDRDQELATVIH